jgi:(p)ppGpp synthase/HD superfamily hydrolase
MYSNGIERALATAIAAHDGQTRKGKGHPYVVHPIHVAMILTRLGVEERVVQAGLLHDVVEDCDGWTIERVEREFGPRVASIVDEVSEDKSKTWEERKREGIAHARSMSSEAATVKAVDKLHNLASLREALASAQDPDEIWARFNGGRERTLAVATELVGALAERVQPALSRALREVLDGLVADEAAAGRSTPEPTSA